MMNTFLQNKQTKDFVQEAGRWTRDQEQAHDFGSFANALQFVRENQLTDVQVIVVFEDNGQEFTLPIHA